MKTNIVTKLICRVLFQNVYYNRDILIWWCYLSNYFFEKIFFKNQDPKDPKVRTKFGMISGLFGIFLNLILFVAKLLIGIFSSSVAATADAFNNLSDAGSSIITIFCFKIASHPADEDHPFGHGRIEYVSSLIVSIAIIITGLGFVKSSVEKIFNPENLGFDLISLIVLVFSVLVKIFMWRFDSFIGKKINSLTIIATSKDCLSDAIATSTVLLGFFISHFTNICVDPYAGLIVSVFIIVTGSKTFKESFGPLMGKAPDRDFIDKISKFVLKNEEIEEIKEISVHNYGPHKSAVSMRVYMADKFDTEKITEIISRIEKSVEEKFGCDIIIQAN